MFDYTLTWTTITPGYYETAPVDAVTEFTARIERVGTGHETWRLTTNTFGRLLSSSWHRTLTQAKQHAQGTYTTVEGVSRPVSDQV